MEDVLGLGFSPGYKFQPDDDELVEHFLLPRILGQQIPLQGVILEDDPLSAPPWELLGKHKRKNDEAFFFANGQPMHDNGSRRQKRTCEGGGYWEGQTVCVDGDRPLRVPGMEEITWKKYMLNYHHPGVEGSMGWVMHEYSITAPVHLASSSLRLYRVRFSGHGKSSKRQPDDDGGAQARAQPDLLEEHNSAANHVFPMVEDLVDDEDGGPAMPAATSYSADQDYQQDLWVNAMNNWPQQDSSSQDFVMPNSEFLPGAYVGEDAGPGTASSDQYFLGGNTMNLGPYSATPSSDQGAPGVWNEYDGAAPAAGMLPYAQGSSSGVIDQSFLDFELPDQHIDYLVFPDQYSSAGMQRQIFDAAHASTGHMAA